MNESQHADGAIVPAEAFDDESLWELLSAYADGEATDAEVRLAEQLINSDPAAAHRFSFLELTSHSVRELSEVNPPARLMDSIFAATTRRKTIGVRIRAFCTQLAAPFGPPPMRLAGAALAGSLVLAVSLWSHHASAPSEPGQANTGPIARVIVPHSLPKSVPPTAPTVPTLGRPAELAVKLRTETKFEMPHLVPAHDMSSFPRELVATNFVKPHPRAIVPGRAAEVHADSHTRPRLDTASSGQVALISNGEQRHMAVGSDPVAGSGRQDDLGPDVVQPSADHDMVAKADVPAPSREVPPTTTAVAVSYHQGSISALSRNTPPVESSLFARTQEAIRRQYEMQQYGGYGKEAYNNIQRGEVGLSLVGGRF